MADNIVENLTHQIVEEGGGENRGASKIIEKSKGSGYVAPEKLEQLVTTATKKCAVLNEQFEKTLIGKKAEIVFSEKVDNAMYDMGSNTIALPTKMEPNNLLDGLIFETCNVEMQQEFEVLNKERANTLKIEKGKIAPSNPVVLKEFARKKSDIEAMSTLKDCQIKLEMLKCEVPLFVQGKKNIASVYRNLKKLGGSDISGFDELLKDEKALDKLLSENVKEIDELFHRAEKDLETNKALCDLMANSPHKSNVEPHETGNLKTEEMYAFETIETEANTSNYANILISDLMKQQKITETKAKTLAAALKTICREFELPYNDNIKHYKKPVDEDHMCRVACLSDVIGLLKKKFGVESFPGLDVTEDMAKLAKIRLEITKEKFPYQWRDEEKDIDFEASLKKAFETFKQKLESL